MYICLCLIMFSYLEQIMPSPSLYGGLHVITRRTCTAGI